MKNNFKKKMMIFGIILAIVGFVSLPIGFLLMNNNNNNEPEKKENNEGKIEIVEQTKELDENQKKVQEAAKLFNSYLVDSTKSTVDYEKLTGIQENYFDPMVGVNSNSQYNVLNEYPEIFTEDYSQYKTMQTKYAENLANAIKENFAFKLRGIPLYTEDKKQLMQVVDVTPFSYTLYQLDLSEVQNKLLDMAKVEKKDSLESFPALYKSHIKAMEILDSHLAEYKNKKKFQTNMIYDIGDSITCNNCHFYINYAEGVYLDSVMPEENYDNKKNKRINKIISEAKKNGIINENKPLELK